MIESIEWPERQVGWSIGADGAIYKMVGRVERTEVCAQVTRIEGSTLGISTSAQPYPALLIAPEAHEGLIAAALSQGEGYPVPYGPMELTVASFFERFGALAVYLPLDRRVVAVRVPFKACVFVFDAVSDLPSSGLVWMRDLSRCGCSR